MTAPNALARNSKGSGCKRTPGALDRDQIAGVKQAREQREQVAAEVARRSSALLPISKAAPIAARSSAAAWIGDGHRRASHSPQAAKAKLETLPNRVALPSLVMWMPVCQAARSAAKKKPASG